jgi:hypothetical protein
MKTIDRLSTSAFSSEHKAVSVKMEDLMREGEAAGHAGPPFSNRIFGNG